MKIKITITLLSLSTLILALLNFLPRQSAGIRDTYYQGIQDYCEFVTILDVKTGEKINRDHNYCVGLVSDLRNKNFYEKYHPSY